MKTLHFATFASAATAAFALFLTSPIIEGRNDNTLFERAITDTCNNRHGLNFVGRWSCRSDHQRLTTEDIWGGCGFGGINFNREDHFCRYLETQFRRDAYREKGARR